MRIFDEIKIGLAQATALLEVKNRLPAKEMAELKEIIKEKNLCELINKNNLFEELSLKLDYVYINKEKFEQKINYIAAASTMPIDEIRARLSEYDKSSPKEDEKNTETESRNNSEVTVGEVLVISDMKVVLEVGSTKIISVVQVPKGYELKDVVCSSSDENVATIDKNGVIKGVGEGSTTIIVQTSDGKYSCACSITIESEGSGEFTPLNFQSVYNNNGMVYVA